MAAAAEIQIGKAVRFGCGATTLTSASIVFVNNEGVNIQSMEMEDTFKLDKIVAQTGGTIETKVASQRERKGHFKIIPKGATRAEALNVLKYFIGDGTGAGTYKGIQPLEVVTISGADIAAWNTTFNYTGGGKLQQTAEGWATVDIGFEQVEDPANAGQFKGLVIV